MVKKERYKMILDSASQNDTLLASGKVYNLNKKFGDMLVKKGRAKKYDLSSAKRIVNINGKEMAWGDYLKRNNRIRKEYENKNP